MIKNLIYDLVVVGAGPAGMAAAVAAQEAGLEKILVLERNSFLGGVLPQCIHDGFGLFEFGCSMTGPEYGAAWEKKLMAYGIETYIDTTVLEITGELPFAVKILGPKTGLAVIRAKSIVLATGCRERTLAQLRIPGSRPAGVYTAGAAQYMMNIQNYLPGKSAVVLGSGDIGLIMARRFTLEGAKIKLILGQKASGLPRNYIQCVKDFAIPIRFGYTVISTHGYKRLRGVTIAPLNNNGEALLAQKEYIPCDTLLVAAGLIPETELWHAGSVPLNKTMGIPTNDIGSTPREGIFACGNVVRVYDTVDEVSQEGRKAGKAAANWILAKEGKPDACKITQKDSVQLTYNQKLTQEDLDALFAEKGSNQSQELMLCVLCPKGCRLKINKNEAGIFVKGNQCPKGKLYALKEYETPERTVTTTVRLQGCKQVLLPVKTDKPVAKDSIFAVMKACRKIVLSGNISVGDVIIKNIAHTGANLVATGNCAAITE